MSFTQRKRAEIIVNCYKKWDISGKKILDVGCGNGVVSEVLQKNLNLDLCGTDIIDYRKIVMPFKKIEKVSKLPFEDSSFDYVMFNDVLHHTEDIEMAIAEGGRVGNSVLIFEDQSSFLLYMVDVALNRLYSSQMPCPLNFKTREQWCFLFDKLGFQYDIGEVSYPFFYPFKHMAFKLTKERNE